VAKAIRVAGAAAPGPDGIPYAAWKALGSLAVDVLTGVASALGEDGVQEELVAAYVDDPDAGEGQHAFNLSLLAVIGKAPAGEERGVPYYDPGGLRPLSLVNCDNRLVASAARFLWEPLFGS